MVVPVAALVVIWLSGLAGVSSAFMPSLNPFTAPPRSAPMLRSFFVPKMSSTMTSTINQCQILNEPMEISVVRASRRALGRHHAAEGLGTAEDVDMQMIHV